MIDFQVERSEAVKFIGRWFDVSKMRFSSPTPTIGPTVTMLIPCSTRANAIFLASPNTNARNVLALSCVPIPRLGPAPEMFMFYGGFDPPERMADPTKEAGFLAFLYPLPEAEKIKERLGSVDYAPKS